MKRTIDVIVDDGPQVGIMRYDLQGRRENAAFEYSAGWLSTETRFALGPTLPLTAGLQFHRKTSDGSIFHAAIADTEPDGWGRRVIMRDHAKRRHETRPDGKEKSAQPLNALDYLLAVDDISRVGALRYRDEGGLFQRAPEAGRRTAPPLIELGQIMNASRAVESNRETAADLAYLRGRGTSLGGLRPKCTVIDNDGALAIGKFPSIADERAVTKGEVLALTLAGKAGINAANARIIESENSPVALIRRFDRRGGRRIMYISAATLLGVEATEPGDHFYTEIVDAIRVHGADVQADIEELWRRIALSILITNVDDHLRNHGFLHEDRGFWRLSPAFDINPTPERSRELKTWISEDTGPEMTVNALMSVLPNFGITHARAKEILGQVERAVGDWRKTGREIGMTEGELEAFTDAFEHEERAAAKRWI